MILTKFMLFSTLQDSSYRAGITTPNLEVVGLVGVVGAVGKVGKVGCRKGKKLREFWKLLREFWAKLTE